MKTTFLALAAFASLAATYATPTLVSERTTSDVNPFLGKDIYLNPVFTAEVNAEIASLKAAGNTALAAKAAKIGTIPTFNWISTSKDVNNISGWLRDAKALQDKTGRKQLAQFVVYNLPDRDCGAKASDGEFKSSQAGEARYEAYVKAIYSEIERVPEVSVVLIIEPDSIGNIVTNTESSPKCATAAPVYKRSISLAIATLSRLPNTSLYVDAAHAGWLGWPGNIEKTAALLAELLNNAKAINPNAKVRGVSTNVSNYNGLGNNVQGFDELRYHRDLAPLLTAQGFPAHFIADQGRSGNQVPLSGTTWCNLKTAGFGPKPTTNTPDAIEDAIVWVKPGGESDGTSDPSSPRFDEACSPDNVNTFQPMPEAGVWSSAIFANLVANTDPSLFA